VQGVLSKVLSSAEIDAIKHRVVEAAESGRDEEARQALLPLLGAQRSQPDAALCLAALVDRRCLPYAPDLGRAAGLRERAAIERRRFDLLRHNTANGHSQRQ
jgi:hypothetical protein